jgi:hypothetical protein
LRRFTQHLGYMSQDPTEITHHIVVPKSQNAKTLAPQPRIAFGIMFDSVRSVLPAVNFNDHSGFETDEIHDIRSNRKLPAER